MRRAVVLLGCLAIAGCTSPTAPPSPTQVVFLVQPSTTVAGQAMTPAVQVAIEDAAGNVVTSATGSVTLILSSGPLGAALLGNATVSAVSGVATFPSLFLNKAGGNYTLQATSGALSAVTSTSFSVIPGAATQLVFTTQPTSVEVGQEMIPPVQVTALDVEGNVATGFAGTVTIGLEANPGEAYLYGTLTTTAIAGVASFADLNVSNQGSGYSLLASAGTYYSTSVPFNVVESGTTGINYNGGPIIYTPKVAAIYWSATPIYNGGPTPGTSGTPAADQSVVGFYLNNLGGSELFNILTTYYDLTNTYIQNTLTYTQYWADAVAPPPAPSNSDIQTEIERGFANGTLVYDPNTVFVVFTGTGINLGGGFGVYCAYHSYFTDPSGRNVKYAALPFDEDYIATQTVAGCGVFTTVSPNNDPAADDEVTALTHELAESATDENANAWFVDTLPVGDGEMADLCDLNFGNVTLAANGSYYNQVFNGKEFLVQMLWVDAETSEGTPVGCQQGWTPAEAASTRRLVRSSPMLARRRPSVDRPHIMHLFYAPRPQLAGSQSDSKRAATDRNPSAPAATASRTTTRQRANR